MLPGALAATDDRTPLDAAVFGSDAERPRPLDALEAARVVLRAGESLDMGRVAEQLGTSRATLYRWVGDRERLLGHAVWSYARQFLDEAEVTAADARPGHDRVASVLAAFVLRVGSSPPFRALVERDPEFALRLLTGPRSIVRSNLTAYVAALIEAQGTEAGWTLPGGTLAFALVRIMESFLYSDIVAGIDVDLDGAVLVLRALVTGSSRPSEMEAG